MSKPILTVVAGCNGSGKSTYSGVLVPDHITPFDFDKLKKSIYDGFKFDFEMRDQMAHQQAYHTFEKAIDHALQTESDFTYETNFNHNPMHWPLMFKSAGYQLNMIFFCLKNTEIAKERVAIRFENGGHFVRDIDVESRYWDGFKNLQKYCSSFSSITLYETSKECSIPEEVIHIHQNHIVRQGHIPKYLEDIVGAIKTGKSKK